MPKKLHFGVFELFGPQIAGTLSWPHPLSEQGNFNDPERWIRLATIMDAAGFDFLFFADSYGYPLLGEDIAPSSITHGINFPRYDPGTIIPVLAQHTERLGFVLTATTGLDHPVQLARKFSTLDLVTDGRIGWNIVTGSSQNAVAKLMGHQEMIPHDVRYEIAEEYLELATMYWEQGWDDDALRVDKSTELFAQPDGVHRLIYEGKHYRTDGYYASPPTPQRTPALFQAGTSPQGRDFAAQHAENVFVAATSIKHTASNVADIRARSKAYGRDPQAIKMMANVTVFTAETHSEAKRLENEFDELQTDEFVAALYAGNTGINLLQLEPDQTLHQVLGQPNGPIGQMGTTNIERYLGNAEESALTVREIVQDLKGRGTRGFRVVGDGQQVADQLERIADQTDVDGFLIEPVFDPRDMEAFGEFVMPQLAERGRLPRVKVGETLRERLSDIPEAGNPS